MGRSSSRLDGAGHLLAEVQLPACDQLSLVERVDLCFLVKPQDLQRLGIAQVQRRQLAGTFGLLDAQSVPRGRPTGAIGRPSCFSLGDRVPSRVSLVQLRRAYLPDAPKLVAGPPRTQVVDRLLIRTCPVFPLEGETLAQRVVGVLIGRDQLILGPRDHLGEAAERLHRTPGQVVVEEVAQLRHKVTQQQPLAHIVEQVGITGQPSFCPMLAQQPIAEAVEVVHPHSTSDLDAKHVLQPLHQLRGGAHVVRQDQDVLWRQRRVTCQQVADPLDDDRGLAGARAGQHHQRPLAPLDCRTLGG